MISELLKVDGLRPKCSERELLTWKHLLPRQLLCGTEEFFTERLALGKELSLHCVTIVTLGYMKESERRKQKARSSLNQRKSESTTAMLLFHILN